MVKPRRLNRAYPNALDSWAIYNNRFDFAGLIKFGEANLLWLPANIRLYYPSRYCANNDTVMLGSCSGRMTLL